MCISDLYLLVFQREAATWLPVCCVCRIKYREWSARVVSSLHPWCTHTAWHHAQTPRGCCRGHHEGRWSQEKGEKYKPFHACTVPKFSCEFSVSNHLIVSNHQHVVFASVRKVLNLWYCWFCYFCDTLSSYICFCVTFITCDRHVILCM